MTMKVTPLTIACTALLFAGCVDAGTALTIVQNQIPETSDTAGCIVPAGRTELRRAIGTLDVGLDQSYPYYMFPLVNNGLHPLAAGTIEPNIVNINSFQVRIEAPPTVGVEWSAACPVQFDFPSPMMLQPGEQGVALVEALRPCHADLLRKLMQQGKLSSSLSEHVIFRLIVRAKGRHGGTEILSDAFEFPLRVCYGCLQTGFLDPAYADFGFPSIPLCSRLAANPYQGNRCNPAQDTGPVLCCARDAEGKQIECPGVPRAGL
jgi:hypothetical protein